jgi:hypothetical protein
MLPVSYEIHCQTCHPLTFDPQRPELAVPHRVQPDKIKEFLQQTYTAEYLSQNPRLLERPVPSRRPLPGKTAPVEGPAEEKARRYIEDKVSVAERILYAGKTTCGECHYYEKKDGLVPQSIRATEVPEIWFAHARFDHRAHRAVSCQACHEQAETSIVHTDVLIPRLAKCLECHDATKNGSAARSDCTECHRYHNGDGIGVYQGPGAEARAPRLKFERSEDFLSGLLKGNEKR